MPSMANPSILNIRHTTFLWREINSLAEAVNGSNTTFPFSPLRIMRIRAGHISTVIRPDSTREMGVDSSLFARMTSEEMFGALFEVNLLAKFRLSQIEQTISGISVRNSPLLLIAVKYTCNENWELYHLYSRQRKK